MADKKEDGKKEIAKKVKEMLIAAQAQHHATGELEKLAADDKECGKLVKDMTGKFKEFHKVLRELLKKTEA